VVTGMDYYKFCEGYQQRCAVRRAELEEDEALLRRSAEFRQRSSEALRQRSGGGDLVYKTVYNVTPTQQQSGGMDAATAAAWNAWAADSIEKFLDENLFTENQKQVLGEAIALLREEFDEKINALRDEIEGLRERGGNIELLKRGQKNVG
jgi:hypothetical protein